MAFPAHAPLPAGRQACPGCDPAYHGIGLLLTGFGDAIDSRRPDDVAALFTADCAFAPPSGEVMRGREAIAAHYRARFADNRRRTCHQWANLRIAPDSGGRADAQAVMTTYAFEPAVSESHAQLRVGKVLGRCERGDDGIWRFAGHRFEMAFPLAIPLRA
jgi:uncharacterized protein (TIGR02246 family)